MDTSAIAVTGGSIHSNGGLGIDLGSSASIDVLANDPGDGGPNEGLNHHVIDHFTVDRSSAVS